MAQSDRMGGGGPGNTPATGAKPAAPGKVVDPDQLNGALPVVEPFKKHFDKCTGQADMGNDCKFEHLGIIGDEAHQKRPSCHNVGEAIDVGFIECAGQKIESANPKYLTFVKCFAEQTGGEMNDIFHQTGGSPNIIQKSDHVKHVHIQIKDCKMVPGKNVNAQELIADFSLENLTSFISSLIIGSPAEAAVELKIKEMGKNFDKKMDAAGVGKLRLKYRYIGEPIAKPADLTVSVQCQGMKKELKIEAMDMCSLTKYDYVAHEKTLNIEAQTARVETNGKVYCDQKLEKSISVGDFCRDQARKTLKK
jgi:hypothetical protein